MALASFSLSRSVARAEGESFMFSSMAWNSSWGMCMAEENTARGPSWSQPAMGEAQASARMSPRYRPSGMAPHRAPPGWWLVTEMAEQRKWPPRAEGIRFAISTHQR